jgi:two-component sensor histidine kinase
MIHQKLYIGKDLATVEMKDYFINLGNHILDSFGAGDRISLSYPMGNIEIDVYTAIPLGLIVNELLTNALKYAFPDKRKGQIIICLQNSGSNLLLLNVSDNGVGQTTKDNKSTGFGTTLIELLMKQLDGNMKITNSKGTSVSFEFKIGK